MPMREDTREPSFSRSIDAKDSAKRKKKTFAPKISTFSRQSHAVSGNSHSKRGVFRSAQGGFAQQVGGGFASDLDAHNSIIRRRRRTRTCSLLLLPVGASASEHFPASRPLIWCSHVFAFTSPCLFPPTSSPFGAHSSVMSSRARLRRHDRPRSLTAVTGNSFVACAVCVLGGGGGGIWFDDGVVGVGIPRLSPCPLWFTHSHLSTPTRPPPTSLGSRRVSSVLQMGRRSESGVSRQSSRVSHCWPWRMRSLPPSQHANTLASPSPSLTLARAVRAPTPPPTPANTPPSNPVVYPAAAVVAHATRTTHPHPQRPLTHRWLPRVYTLPVTLPPLSR
jgi:hypothetical protein